MRLGEITGLRWQHLSFGDEENGFADASLNIEAQLQRISVKVSEVLERKQDEIKFVFQSVKSDAKTILLMV
jgi:hypothetical protein